MEIADDGTEVASVRCEVTEFALQISVGPLARPLAGIDPFAESGRHFLTPST